uniref:EGF-like domain-containing protein n=1 Tax=Tetradesmus obliquus TaxID=3088 RepID=A0A383WAS0_TETOB|eukprot:jgi/Sobl393_1/10681/SZX74717.1
MRSAAGRCCWLALLVLVTALGSDAAFLQNQLPLEVVLTTPSALLDNSTKSIKVEEGQAFMAVFSRPVIALGSDFGKQALPDALVPFKVNCPVPGMFRWVTTNIARWDPSIAWPTDLDCELSWNTAIKTFDGAPLVLTGPPKVRISSSPITFDVANIASASANKATDDQWNAYRGMADDKFPEVPPDANITLTFSYPVLLSALQSALAVVPCCGSNAGSSQSIKVLPCGPPYVVVDPFAPAAKQLQQQQNSTCAVVRLVPGLPASGVAMLRLPKGVRYNTVSGPTKNDTNVYLWGLRRFRIPLRTNFQQPDSPAAALEQENTISYRRLLMWLPHGTAADVSIEMLQAQMYLCKYDDPYKWKTPCKQIPFTLERVNRGQLLLTVPSLMPRQHYQLKVAGSAAIRDAYGLPLEDSTAYFFTNEPAADLSFPELSSSSSVMVLEPDAQQRPLQWPVVYRGNGSQDWDAQGVSVWAFPDKPAKGLRVLAADYSKQTVQTLGTPAESFSRSFSALTATKVLTLSGKPGVQLVGTPTRSTYESLSNRVMVVQSDLQYASIVVGSNITHLVTLTSPAATPLAGAKVSLTLYKCCGEAPVPGPFCTTGSDGTCSVDIKSMVQGNYGTLSGLVEATGHGTLVINSITTPSYYEDEALQYAYVGELVMDRSIVMPGDKLHITGFLQERSGKGDRLALPVGLTTVNVTVMPSFSGTTDDKPLVIPVKVNASYGSFHAIIDVPAGAKPGAYSLTLVTPKTRPRTAPTASSSSSDDDGASVASESFTVGNPRPPTALLNVTVPDWSPPSSTVKVLIKASSYLGADVSGANIDITWTLPLASGAFNVTTDAKGLAEASIPLGQLPPKNASSLGDQLSLTAVWIGPTRERIRETAAVRIANGPVRVELSRSPNTDIPGIPFIMSARTWLNDKDGSQLEGVTVEVYLKPNTSESLANCSASANAQLRTQRCQIVSGKPATAKPCAITLPCAADLKLVACAVSYANGSQVLGVNGQPACSETPIGRNQSDWEAAPWAFLPDLGLLKDRQNYTIGSTAVLSFMNPYWRPASGLLVWGNMRLQKQKALSNIPKGPNSISITVGEECLGGCKAHLVLSLPRPSAAETAQIGPSMTPMQLKLPKSKLFNPLAPATASAVVDLTVYEDNRLNVTVKVVPAAAAAAAAGLPKGLFKTSAVGIGGQEVPVMKSDAEADIEVKVTDALTGKPAVDAEVTVVVVDESILALLPYPLPDVPAGLVAYPYVSSYIKEINECRTSRSNINITFATLQRRLALDPWLPLVTTVTPSAYVDYASWGSRTRYPAASPVDSSDATYLRGFTNSLTVTPFYSWGLSQRYPSGSKAGGDASAQLRLSSEFKTVPVFTIVQTKTDGSASIRFKSPPNLGTFNVRAYAVSKGSTDKPSKYGANETQVIVRRPISLTASTPQSVRVGDDFEAGVIVSSPDAAAPITVEITAQMAAATTGVDTSSNATSAVADDGSLVLLPKDPVVQTVSITPQQQQVEVRFRYQAKAIGMSGLRFDARVPTIASADAADATQQDVTVQGQQGGVFIATSFALQAGSSVNGSSGRQEGLELPDATPGSGTVDLLAGVGYLPAIKTSYNAFVQQQARRAAESDSYIPWGPDAVCTALLPAYLARYSPSTAVMLASASSSKPGTTPLVTLAQLNASATAANVLKTKLTRPTLGLMYYVPDGEYYSSPSVELNSWAVWLAEQAQQSNTLQGLAFSSSIKAAAATWKAAAEEQLVKNAKEAREPSPASLSAYYGGKPANMYMDFEELSWARLALGPDWAPKGVSSNVTRDLSLSRLVTAATTPKNTSLGCQARTGLLLTQVVAANGKSTYGVTVAEAKVGIGKLAKQMLGNVRVAGRTAYLTSDPGSASAAMQEDQALALAFLVQQDLPGAREVLPKLAAYVSGGQASIARSGIAATSVSVGGTAPGTVAAALSAYDKSRGNTSPDAKLVVSAISGGSSSSAAVGSSAAPKQAQLLSASFTPTTAGALANSSTPWSALPANPKLQFEVRGSAGEVAVAAGLDFIPAQLLPFPSYRGLWVERVIQSEAGQGNLAAAALADVVTVTVQLTTPDALQSGVVVEVLMPGGLEPIDPLVYQDAAAATQCDFGDSYFSRWWCPAQSTLRSAVTFKFGYLGAGTVNLKFKAIAATPGTFVLPPVKAYSVQQPELMGLSAAGEFTVCPSRRGANAAAATTGVVKTQGAAAFAVCGAAGAAQQPLPAAKSCPGNCSSNGVCNLLSGACLCNAGFTGASCNVYSAAAV